MKNLITALNAAAHEADNIVGKSNNSAKGTVYAGTSQAINELKPLLKRHGLSFSVIPCDFNYTSVLLSKDSKGIEFNEIAGTQSVRIIVTHSSGEMWDAGTASMPVNVQNKGMTSLDKAMGALTVLTRKAWLGLLGVVEVDSYEKTLAALSEQEVKDAEITEQARIVAESSKTSDEARKNYRSFVPKDGNSGLSKSAEQKILAMFVKRASELDAQSAQGEQQ